MWLAAGRAAAGASIAGPAGLTAGGAGALGSPAAGHHQAWGCGLRSSKQGRVTSAAEQGRSKPVGAVRPSDVGAVVRPPRRRSMMKLAGARPPSGQ